MTVYRLANALVCLCGMPRRVRSRRGQTIAEYLLLLAGVVGLAVTLLLLVGDRLLGALFTVVGMILPAAS